MALLVHKHCVNMDLLWNDFKSCNIFSTYQSVIISMLIHLLYPVYQPEELWLCNFISLIRLRFMVLEFLLDVCVMENFFIIKNFIFFWNKLLVPYLCATGGLVSANMCMISPLITNVNNLINNANSLANSNQIDPVGNIRGDRVFIFHGSMDFTVVPGNEMLY